ATAPGWPAAADAHADAKPRSGSDSRPVDQPTAVFKAFGKRTGAAPAVDQPTTALKVPPADAAPAKRGGGKPAPKWATGAGADGDGERPGTFVPLRSDETRTAAPARTQAADGTAPAPAARGTEPAKASAATTTAAGSGTRTGSETRTAPAKGTGKAAGVGSGAGTAPGGDPEVTAAVAPPALTEAERTKQQPLPPRPPLDMLAELTNTPPPPETPLRTLVRRVKIWTPLVVLLLIVFATVQLLRPLPNPSLTLTAEPTYTFEGGALKMPWPTEGQGAVEVEGVGVVGTYGPQQPAPTASVAKAMTAYVILRDHPIKDKDAGPKLVIDQKTEDQASNPDWSTAPVKKGQEYTQGELLQLLMVRSANNVAHFLARWDAGSEEAFIKKMNAAAKELGMTNTTYTDASGFDKGTVSTPKDQLKLAKAAMRFDAFRQIVDMPNVELPQIGRRLENGNTILLRDGVTGIKTGTSTPAGGNLLWSANTVVDGEVRRVIGVVMNVKSGVTLSDKTKLAVETYSYGLIKAAQDGVVSAVAVKEGDVVGYVDDGLGGRTPVVATEDLKPVGWAGLNVELKLAEGEDGKGGLPRTASGGTVVGELAVGTGEGRVSVPVALQHQLEEPGLGAKLTRIS
ncbi:D-alanyl-D-alanine carboxypeptidase family protein, partial [Streptomyces thermolilacinus]|uniref:D-alanyl-D-alanine carboxypeptidase family protein n=1 Tax=Streptomyces thermolilacinus TaxID=285540 RepID=UPI0033DA7047